MNSNSIYSAAVTDEKENRIPVEVIKSNFFLKYLLYIHIYLHLK